MCLSKLSDLFSRRICLGCVVQELSHILNLAGSRFSLLTEFQFKFCTRLSPRKSSPQAWFYRISLFFLVGLLGQISVVTVLFCFEYTLFLVGDETLSFHSVRLSVAR